jgi:acetyl esterase/lipase
MTSLRLKLVLVVLAMFACSVGQARNRPNLPEARSKAVNFCNPPAGNPNNSLPANMCFQFNVSYGSDPLQKMDVYTPATGASDAPVVFMVHGGGWYQGDKLDTPVVRNKVEAWVPTGVVFVSVNYPLVPQANPLDQARSIAMALGYAQRHATEWGGDPDKFIVIGFSAGGHLVSLLAADPSLVQSTPASVRARPWLGTIALDSAVYDVPEAMNNPYHPALYDNAFGTDQALWSEASPTTQMNARMAPFLAVCSTQETGSCTRAQDFVDKALGYGTDALVIQENLMHGDINGTLGLTSNYTSQVDAFMTGLLNGTLR